MRGPTPPPSPSRTRLRPLVAAFALLATLVALELGLQLASLAFGERASPAGPGAETILTLGDSHTYGIGIEEADTYPGRLQRILARRAPGRFRVLNLGLPGTSSTEIAAGFRRRLLSEGASRAVVCVGLNNLWNRSRPGPDQPGFELRLARLLRLAWRGWRDREEHWTRRPPLRRVLLDEGRSGVRLVDAATGQVLVEHEGDLHTRSLTLEQAATQLRADLEGMVGDARELGVELLLLGYAAGELLPAHRALNATMRAVAEAEDLRFVDPAPQFSRELGPAVDPKSAAWARLFLRTRDDHPNGDGYARIAELVADALAE